MFGRVRPSSSSVDSLERPPSKILKDDSLSIYEATLLKLKLGAKHDLSSQSEAAMEIQGSCASSSLLECLSDAPSSVCSDIIKKQVSASISHDEGAMMGDKDCSSANTSPTSDYQSRRSLKPHESRNMSVVYLFSKYKSLHHHSHGSSSEESMIIESDSYFGSITQISG